MVTEKDALSAIVEESLDAQLPPEIAVLADKVAARHAPGAVAVLAYGSCLRGTSTSESLIDLYVLTQDEASISTNPLSRIACRLVPPNVYYVEAEHGGATYRAKYAVLTLDAFAERMRPETRNPYFWARFAQPCALVQVQSERVRHQVVAALTQAARTMLATCIELSGSDDNTQDLWANGLRATYSTELRSEPPDRAKEIAAANSDYYGRITQTVLAGKHALPSAQDPSPNLTGDWRARRRTGKLLSVARLIKAAFTFQGGADYLAWKVSRHSGQQIELKPWQRRHPILASLVLLPKLLKSGAVR